jgi:cytochrome b involved in lipid metabolism
MFDFFKKKCYVKIHNDWYNLKKFLKLHPGGNKILQKYHMKDATDKFFSIRAHYNYIQVLDRYLITDIFLIVKLNNKFNDKLNKKLNEKVK